MCDEYCECDCHSEHTNMGGYTGPPPTKEELEMVFLEPVCSPLTALLSGKRSSSEGEPRE
jgi:hypothetical protein